MEPAQERLEKPTCPQCFYSDHVIPIIYGKPTRQHFEQWKNHEVELGGCVVINGEQPPWTCTQCKILIRVSQIISSK